MITFEQTPFAEVKLFRFDGVTDNRGFKISTWSREDFLQHGIDFAPVESVIYEIPVAGTLYGIHFQLKPKPQQKLISLISGAGVDYAIDLRPDSPTFKKWFSTELSATNHRQILIPRGFGHLFYSTVPDTKMLFQIDQEFDTALSQTISYRDSEIALDICDRDFIVSPKDAAAPMMSSIVLKAPTPSNPQIQVLRASEEWQRAGAYSVRIEGMNRQHHIPLRDEFDEHDCDGTKYIVLLDDGYPVATCRFYENDANTVTLGRVVVLPEYRGLGLGKKVVTEAENWAKELGYQKINIDSRIEAIQFYEKLGYLHATGNDEIIKSGSFECVEMYKWI